MPLRGLAPAQQGDGRSQALLSRRGAARPGTTMNSFPLRQGQGKRAPEGLVLICQLLENRNTKAPCTQGPVTVNPGCECLKEQ